MKKVLVITHNGEKLSSFIKEYFYGVNYATIYGENATIFDATGTIVVSVEPYTHLIGHRYHEIYVDSDIKIFAKKELSEYKNSIFDALYQKIPVFVKEF